MFEPSYPSTKDDGEPIYFTLSERGYYSDPKRADRVTVRIVTVRRRSQYTRITSLYDNFVKLGV